MKFRVDWDTDEEGIQLPEIVDVPDDVELDDVADWLSDKYGWCVNGLVEVTKKELTLG